MGSSGWRFTPAHAGEGAAGEESVFFVGVLRAAAAALPMACTIACPLDYHLQLQLVI